MKPVTEALCKLRDMAPFVPSPSAGICHNLLDLLQQTMVDHSAVSLSHCSALRAFRAFRTSAPAAYRAWPLYSGNADFPVPAFDEAGDPVPSTLNAHGFPPEEMAYMDSIVDANKWNAAGPYGTARLDLLDHLIAYFERVGE